MDPGTSRPTRAREHARASDTPMEDGPRVRRSTHRRQDFGVPPSVVVAIAGVWLASAPFVLDYSGTGRGYSGRWNDLVVGVVMIAVAMVRVVTPRGTGPLSMINVGLGVWLIASPFVLGHSEAGATLATWNDIVVGLIVVMVAGVSCFTAESKRTHADVVRRRRGMQPAAGDRSGVEREPGSEDGPGLSRRGS